MLGDGTWVRLVGPPSAVADLVETFSDPPAVEFAQRDDDDSWWITSDRFAGLSDGAEVRSVAADLIAVLNGLATVSFGPQEPVTAGTVYFIDSSTGRDEQVVLVEPAISRSRVGRPTVMINGVADPAPLPELEWLRAAAVDNRVASIARVIGRPDPTWSELFHVLELIEDVLGQPVSGCQWTSGAQRTRFRHTANSRTAAGDDARHGNERTQPPPNPMSLDEARLLIRDLARRLFDHVAI